MGVQVVAKGVDAEQYATEYAAPVRRGLEGIFFTNTSLEKCARNYAAGKPAGSIVGAPAPAAGYVSLKGNTNYIQTQIQETESITMLVIARQVLDPANPAAITMFCGTYNSGQVSGVSIYIPAADRVSGTAGFGIDDAGNANTVTSVSPLVPTNWGLYSVTISPTGVTTKSHTANLSTTNVRVDPRRPSTRTVRIGMGYYAAHSGLSDIAVYQHHSVALTADELTKTVADLRAYAARRGIVV
ncbi:hypothetical protein HCU66_20755 [Pseudomonas frederiksbergensis]|uniref:hypothetical protein n=1 Tax=Pseudomonas frederiksbergensis TaxID=104087 RepID=UPI00197DEB4C|nr:hypothetical protein [Pseudomonas frederiksbergensis]MBN3864666.1 hypothetical protein [Pseudomonas frederiksbergensis]